MVVSEFWVREWAVLTVNIARGETPVAKKVKETKINIVKNNMAPLLDSSGVTNDKFPLLW